MQEVLYMPLRYWYHCQDCDYEAYRYRNVRRCPDCGGILIRQEGGEPPRQWLMDPVKTEPVLAVPGHSIPEAQ
jgi:hypothetical protein